MQGPGLKLQFGFVSQFTDVVVFERVSKLSHAVVKPAHRFHVFRWDARAHQKLTMIFILEPSRAMTSLPIVHEHFRVLRFIAQRARQTAVIFMRMREHDPSNVCHRDSRISQS